jgi:hypothetical protein
LKSIVSNALRFGVRFFKKRKNAINELIEELSAETAQIAKFPSFFSLGGGGGKPPDASARAICLMNVAIYRIRQYILHNYKYEFTNVEF